MLTEVVFVIEPHDRTMTTTSIKSFEAYSTTSTTQSPISFPNFHLFPPELHLTITSHALATALTPNKSKTLVIHMRLTITKRIITLPKLLPIYHVNTLFRQEVLRLYSLTQTVDARISPRHMLLWQCLISAAMTPN